MNFNFRLPYRVQKNKKCCILSIKQLLLKKIYIIMGNLDINSEKGQITVRQENKMLKYIEKYMRIA